MLPTRSPCQDPAGNRTTRTPPDHGKETKTAVIRSCLPLIRYSQIHIASHNERGKKTRQTEEEVENNIREWTGLEFANSQQWRTEKNAGNWLWNHQWCPNDPRDKWSEVKWIQFAIFESESFVLSAILSEVHVGCCGQITVNRSEVNLSEIV